MLNWWLCRNIMCTALWSSNPAEFDTCHTFTPKGTYLSSIEYNGTFFWVIPQITKKWISGHQKEHCGAISRKSHHPFLCSLKSIDFSLWAALNRGLFHILLSRWPWSLYCGASIDLASSFLAFSVSCFSNVPLDGNWSLCLWWVQKCLIMLDSDLDSSCSYPFCMTPSPVSNKALSISAWQSGRNHLLLFTVPSSCKIREQDWNTHNSLQKLALSLSVDWQEVLE